MEDQVQMGLELPPAEDWYVAPELVEVGDVVELTHGTSFNDTADRKVYYY